MVRLLFILFTLPLPVFALKIVPVESDWTAKIPHPVSLSKCGKSLFVYSRSDLAVYELSAENGKQLKKIEFLKHRKDHQLAALACHRGDLLALFNNTRSGHFSGVDRLNGETVRWKELAKAQKFPTRASDMTCEGNTCNLLFEKSLQATESFIKWKEQKLPPAKEISHKESRSSLNPFGDWQDKLELSHGAYSRLSISQDQVVLLNSLKSQVIVLKNSEFSKWGTWGVWEGHLLSPKDLVATDKGNIVISDAGLKTISIFNRDGEFVGNLGRSGALLDLNYPMDLAVSDGRIFVADLFSNEVAAYLWNEYTPGFGPEKIWKRENLFRREAVLKDRFRNRCLSCHDGTVSDDLDKHLSSSHPVNMISELKTDLPLDEGKVLTCMTCHDPHHGSRPSDSDSSSSAKKPFLRKPELSLCLSCHQTESQKDRNHSKSCLSCHSVHHGQDQLLKSKTESLCLSCHARMDFQHRSLDSLQDISVTKQVKLHGNKISCQTCHEAHLAKPSSALLGDRESILPLCIACHGKKSENLFDHFHEKITRSPK
jgi:predicted CXXCH cytochrome family protein